jgi:hypothetical protein
MTASTLAFPNCKPKCNTAEHATIARLQVLTAMWFQIEVLCNVVLSHWTNGPQHFEGSWYLHLQVKVIPPLSKMAPPRSFKMSETTHRTTQHHVPEDLYCHGTIITLYHVRLCYAKYEQCLKLMLYFLMRSIYATSIVFTQKLLFRKCKNIFQHKEWLIYTCHSSLCLQHEP